MSKKLLAVIGLAALIAVSAGVITYVGTSNNQSDVTQPTSAAATEPLTDPTPESEAEVTQATDPPTQDDTQEATQPTDSSGRDTHDLASILTTAGSYRIAAVYRHTDGAVCSAREVFGKSHASCYLLFKDSGIFELCVNPSAGEIRRGTYLIYDTVISVRYDSGTGSEFTVLMNSSGGIDYIVVNYGDYDVYFG